MLLARLATTSDGASTILATDDDAAETELPTLLTPAEAAAALRVSRGTVYRRFFDRYSRRPDGAAPGTEELLEAMIGPSPRLDGGRHGTGTLYTGFPKYDGISDGATV